MLAGSFAPRPAASGWPAESFIIRHGFGYLTLSSIAEKQVPHPFLAASRLRTGSE
jgi:hypothetical protein